MGANFSPKCTHNSKICTYKKWYQNFRLLTQKKQVQKVLAFFVLMIFKQFLDYGYMYVI